MADTAAHPEVRVHFFTHQTQHAITSQPIALSVKLGRRELNQAVNSLLKLERGDEHEEKQFEFLINGQYLRGSLGAAVAKHAISIEDMVNVEYLEALQPPEPTAAFKHDDWVSSVAAQSAALFATGSYDGIVRVWNESAECTASSNNSHQQPVSQVAWVDATTVVSASKDETLRLWALDAELNCTTVFRGHTAAVCCLAVQPTANMIASGGWDRTVKIWKLGASDDDEHDEETPQTTKSKRARKSPVVLKKPLSSFEGSKGYIASMFWLDDCVYSAGEDHCIREWNVLTGANTHTLTGSQVINSVRVSPLSGFIASADFDGAVRVHDRRTASGSAVKMALTPVSERARTLNGRGMVSVFRTAGTGAKVDVWDIRSATKPLFSVDNSNKKVLCVDWATDSVLVSGGADSELKVHQFQ